MPNRKSSTKRAATLLPLLAVGAFAGGLFLLEKRRPLRRQNQDEPQRSARNLALGALSMLVVATLQRPVVEPLTRTVRSRRIGLVQQLPLPDWLRDAAAILALDYTIYLWHVATHRVPFLWRIHRVHHADLDLDTTTALRFHAAEMALSVPYRALQVAAIGVSPRALGLWQRFFFLSVLFHHSNLRLSLQAERLIGRALVTPRMHGIHHSVVPAEANSNMSSGLAVWDRLHGSLKTDVPQDAIRIGVADLRDPRDIRLVPSLLMPFARRDQPSPAPAARTDRKAAIVPAS